MQLVREACLVDLMASAIFTPHSYRQYVFNWSIINDHNMEFETDYNYDDARFLLQLSFMVTNSNFQNKPFEVPNWLEAIPLNYKKCPVETLMIKSEFGKDGNLGYVLYSKRKNIIFIVFSGTSNVCMAGIDLDHAQTELNNILNYIPGMKGHKGIYFAYLSIREQLIEIITRYLNDKPKIIITGHSLGAAMSTLCTLDLAFYDPLHYSFASPLFFNPKGCEIFTQLVKNSYRICNLSDLITLSPLPIMPNGDCFCHIGKLIAFQRNMCKYYDNHSMAYILEYNIPYAK